eukprot:COSAG06_NODE_527_length_14654_cov_6.880179_6_plen_73_part_00
MAAGWLLSAGCRRGDAAIRIGDVHQSGEVLRFEVRFGANAVSSRFATAPPSRMIQVNLANDNTRVVVEQARP